MTRYLQERDVNEADVKSFVSAGVRTVFAR
jgi:hypothetical protein